MEFKCNSCNKNFKSESSLSQHNTSKHSISENKSLKINYKKYLIFSILILIVIFSSLTVYSYMKRPGQYDKFAKCLTDNGVIVYGNDFCHYTQNQLGYFGKSRSYLNYVKCVDNEALCNEKKIRITPTWEIDGKIYEGVQDFKKLSLLSKCDI